LCLNDCAYARLSQIEIIYLFETHPHNYRPTPTTPHTLPIPTYDRLHLPLVEGAEARITLSLEPFPREELHMIHNQLDSQSPSNKDYIIAGVLDSPHNIKSNQQQT